MLREGVRVSLAPLLPSKTKGSSSHGPGTAAPPAQSDPTAAARLAHWEPSEEEGPRRASSAGGGGLRSGRRGGGKAAAAFSDREVVSLATFCLVQTAVTACNQNHDRSAIVCLFLYSNLVAVQEI